MIDGMIERLESELGYETTVVVTGGIAKFVIPMCKREMIYDKDLIIKGLSALYRENKKSILENEHKEHCGYSAQGSNNC